MIKRNDKETNSNNDILFTNSLYKQAHETPSMSHKLLLLVITLFFITAVSWAYFAEIDELARGEGKVIPATKIQNIQSLDGGIISEILVKDAEHVQVNQPLMKIDPVRFKASMDENTEVKFSLLARKSRLENEALIDLDALTGELPTLYFSDDLKNSSSIYIPIEEKLFKKRFIELKSSIEVLQLQYEQKEQELQEIVDKKNQAKKTYTILSKQKSTIAKMVKNGSKSKMELLTIENQLNKANGDLKNALTAIAKSKLAIAEAKSKIEEKLNSFKSEIAADLQKTETDIRTVNAKLVSDQDKLVKTIIRSPVDGIIKQININTIGGVVRSGDSLIEIVPDTEYMLVEAKISPKDIAFINPLSKAIVKITAYDFSIYGGLEGVIQEISADTIKDVDAQDGRSYYKIVVKTDRNYLERDGQRLEIIPGMIASVDIVTGKKTIMDFILKPILKTKSGALHER
jgi:adhesin transport system membrane fusion protein